MSQGRTIQQTTHIHGLGRWPLGCGCLFGRNRVQGSLLFVLEAKCVSHCLFRQGLHKNCKPTNLYSAMGNLLLLCAVIQFPMCEWHPSDRRLLICCCEHSCMCTTRKHFGIASATGGSHFFLLCPSVFPCASSGQHATSV